MNISAEEYAHKKAAEFKSSFFSNSLGSENSHSNPDQFKNASLEEFSDGEPKLLINHTKSAHEIVYNYDVKESSGVKS
jgi:hypothetical protein